MQILSEDFTQSLVDFVLNTKVYDNPLELEYYNQLYLPLAFLKHPNGVKGFYDRNDQEALSVYFYLLKQYAQAKQPASIEVDLEELTPFLIGKKHRRRSALRNRAYGMLERLKVTYVLIDLENGSEKGKYRVSFYDYATTGVLSLPFCEGIRISNVFFEADWVKALSVGAQYVYYFSSEGFSNRCFVL